MHHASLELLQTHNILLEIRFTFPFPWIVQLVLAVVVTSFFPLCLSS